MADEEQPVLFAYDASEQAKASIREAARQLTPGRRGIVLTVWQPLAAIGFAGAPIVGADVATSIERDADRVAQEGAKLARDAGFDARPLAEAGDPVWRQIVDAAARNHVGMIVLGSHGRTGIAEVLLGSVAASVAKHTDLPVLISHIRSGEARDDHGT